MPRKIVVQEFLSIDGVMQAPGTKHEDTSGDFHEGGWMLPFYDQKIVELMLEEYGSSSALLFGHTTFKVFSEYWPTAPVNDPFASTMNNVIKYVVSDKDVDLTWQNSIQIKDDIFDQINKLKVTDGGAIIIIGSGQLVGELIVRNLVDEYLLMVAPITLGKGKRLFKDKPQKQILKLLEVTSNSKGVVITRYEVVN